MIIVCMVVISDAYISLRYTNLHISNVMTEAVLKVSSDTSFVSKQQAKAYLDQLEAKSSSTLDSSTISFLFQLFTIALVGACIYLFSESHKNLTKMRNAAKTALVHMTFQRIVRLETYFAYAYQLSLSIYIAPINRESMIPVLRQRLTIIKDDLTDNRTNKVAIEKSIVNLFIDDTGYIKTNLSSLDPPVKDLQVFCDDIITLLKEGKFDERYDLLSKSIQKSLG